MQRGPHTIPGAALDDRALAGLPCSKFELRQSIHRAAAMRSWLAAWAWTWAWACVCMSGRGEELAGLIDVSESRADGSSQGNTLFYWFFPARNGDADAPLLLWLQGGPVGGHTHQLCVRVVPRCSVRAGQLWKHRALLREWALLPRRGALCVCAFAYGNL
jgi:hypothetical protein